MTGSQAAAARGRPCHRLDAWSAGGGLRRCPSSLSGYRIFQFTLVLRLRDRAARPQHPDRLQRPDLARPRRLLRARRLYDGDHDRPLERAVRLDASRRPACSASSWASSSACPALRLEGLYLALATFALALAVPQILKYFDDWTGGSQGIVLSKPKAPWGLPLNPDQWLYFFDARRHCVALFVARAGTCCAAGSGAPSWRSATTPSPPRRWASTTRSTSRSTFGVSAAYTGIAGALGALAVAFVAPDSFNVFLSITLLVGHRGRRARARSRARSSAPSSSSSSRTTRRTISKAAPWAIYGVFLIVFMYVMPRGVAGSLRLVWSRLHAASAGKAVTTHATGGHHERDIASILRTRSRLLARWP